MAQRFIKKEKVVEAEQYTGQNNPFGILQNHKCNYRMCPLCGGDDQEHMYFDRNIVWPGDYVLKDASGRFESYSADSFQKLYIPSPSPDREVGGLRWVRASDIEYEMVTRVVFAKRADDFTCKGIGRFQQSDGTFFWQVQGIIPIPLKDHDKLLILCEDESPSLPADKPESPESFKKWLDYNCDPHNATAVDSAPFVEWLDKEIEGTGFPDVFTRKLIAVKQKYLSLRQPQALPIEEGGEMPSELNEWMSEEEDKIDNIEHMFGYRLGAIAMWKRIGFEREEALTLAGKMGEGWRRETQELFSLRTQLQSLTEERDAIKTAYAEQREELEKARYSMRECYYDGFNQAHYSHLHPDVCPPKELEQAATEYFSKKFSSQK